MAALPLRAAVSHVVITPPIGMYLIGYADRAGGARSVHDDLTGSVLVLDDGVSRAALVTLDILGLNWQVVERIRHGIEQAAGIPHHQIMVCCSHTHSGPVGYAPVFPSLRHDLLELWDRLLLIPTGAQPRGWRFNKRYFDGVVQKLAHAAAEAINALAPAEMQWGQGQSLIGHNRRERKPDGKIEIGTNPDGPIDRSVSVLAIRQRDQTLATVVNFACHATIMGPNSYAVSADWVGAMRTFVEAAVGGLCLFVQGACGDINPQTEWTENDWPAVGAKGLEVGEEVVRISQNVSPLSGVPICAESATVWASLVPPPPRPDGSRPTYRDRLHDLTEVIPTLLVDPLLDLRYPWNTMVREDDGAYQTPIDVSALRLGDLAIVSVSMEPFTEIGLAVKQASPARATMFAGYTNGLTGYLATASEHALGGYEVEMAPYFYRLPGILDPHTDQQVVDQMSALLAKVYASA